MSHGRVPRPTRRGLVVAVVLVVAVAVVAGTATAATRRDDAAADDRRVAATAILQHAAGTGEVPAASSALRDQMATAEDLRVGMRMLLGRHVSTTARTIDGAVTGAPDLEADARSLRSNSQALAAAVALVYGAAGGRAFDELWSQHAQLLVAYAAARGTGDDGAADEALAALAQYQADFASFCELATGLPAPTVEDLVEDHLDHLLAYADAVADGDREAATAILAAALTDVVVVADALTTAIVAEHADAFPGRAGSADVERLAVTTSAVQRTTSLLVEGARSGVDFEVTPGFDAPGTEVAAAWADVVAAAAHDGAASSSALARAAEADGVPDDLAVALVDAVDTWLAALDAHRTAREAGPGRDSTDAAARAERAAVDVGAAFAALPSR